MTDERTDEEKIAEQAAAEARRFADDLSNKLRAHLGRHLTDQGRADLVRGFLDSFVSTETMLRGLPKLIDALNGEPRLADIETHRLNLGKTIREARAAGMTSEDAARFREFITGVYDHALPVLRMLDTMAKSMQAIAKTQMGLARGLQASNSALLAYVLSASSTKDAALGILAAAKADNKIADIIREAQARTKSEAPPAP